MLPPSVTQVSHYDLREDIPVPQSSWKEAVLVAVGTGAESYDSILFLSCWTLSRSDVVWDLNGYLLVNSFVKRC